MNKLGKKVKQLIDFKQLSFNVSFFETAHITWLNSSDNIPSFSVYLCAHVFHLCTSNIHSQTLQIFNVLTTLFFENVLFYFGPMKAKKCVSFDIICLFYC